MGFTGGVGRHRWLVWEASGCGTIRCSWRKSAEESRDSSISSSAAWCHASYGSECVELGFNIVFERKKERFCARETRNNERKRKKERAGRLAGTFDRSVDLPLTGASTTLNTHPALASPIAFILTTTVVWTWFYYIKPSIPIFIIDWLKKCLID